MPEPRRNAWRSGKHLRPDFLRTGYSGLLPGKKAVLLLTSAVFGDGQPASFGIDFQRPYLEWWLNWAGIEDVSTIEFRPNLVVEQADLLRAAALDEVREAALKL